MFFAILFLQGSRDGRAGLGHSLANVSGEEMEWK
jgi:hypothetical protein